jgi:hypothetical protein
MLVPRLFGNRFQPEVGQVRADDTERAAQLRRPSRRVWVTAAGYAWPTCPASSSRSRCGSSCRSARSSAATLLPLPVVPAQRPTPERLDGEPRHRGSHQDYDEINCDRGAGHRRGAARRSPDGEHYRGRAERRSYPADDLVATPGSDGLPSTGTPCRDRVGQRLVLHLIIPTSSRLPGQQSTATLPCNDKGVKAPQS